MNWINFFLVHETAVRRMAWVWESSRSVYNSTANCLIARPTLNNFIKQPLFQLAPASSRSIQLKARDESQQIRWRSSSWNVKIFVFKKVIDTLLCLLCSQFACIRHTNSGECIDRVKGRRGRDKLKTSKFLSQTSEFGRKTFHEITTQRCTWMIDTRRNSPNNRESNLLLLSILH